MPLANEIYLFIYFILLFSHNKDYTSITLYKDVARGPQKTTRLVRGGPLVTIILSNRTITTHNNGQYKTHYRYSRKSKTFVLKDCTSWITNQNQWQSSDQLSCPASTGKEKWMKVTGAVTFIYIDKHSKTELACNFRSALSARSIWNFSPEYSLNCTPLSVC